MRKIPVCCSRIRTNRAFTLHAILPGERCSIFLVQLAIFASLSPRCLLLPNTNSNTEQGDAECFNNYEALIAREAERANIDHTDGREPWKDRITYYICPNTVFDLTGQSSWDLKPNTVYVCGYYGSSAENCVVTGGQIQFKVSQFPYSFSNDTNSNIVLRGFTFEKAGTTSGLIASSGNFEICDCIFKNHLSHSALSLVFYIPPTLHRNRLLKSLSNDDEVENFDDLSDLMNFINDPELQQQRQNDRSLLIGGGSEPRLTLLLSRVQFVKNRMAGPLHSPSLATNSPLAIATAFADVTVSNCLFKDNYYPYRSSSTLSHGSAIRVPSSSTLSISDTCFVNEYYSTRATVWIQSDSGLVLSERNYVSETPLDQTSNKISDCQYIFKEEAYECKAPDSDVCFHPACAASYKLYNYGGVDTFFADVVDGATITSPPCYLSIEVVLPCVTKGKSVVIEIYEDNGPLIQQTTSKGKRFFSLIPKRSALKPGIIYIIRAAVDDIEQPSAITFSIDGSCIP